MAVRTIYSCDHCEKDAADKKDLRRIYFNIQLEKDEGTDTGRSPYWAKYVCDECLGEFGISKGEEKPEYIPNYVKVERNWLSILKHFFSNKE